MSNNINRYIGLNENGNVDFLAHNVHEIGHALGLGHSNNRGDILYRTSQGKYPNPSLGNAFLSENDIANLEKQQNLPLPPSAPLREIHL